MPTRDSLSPNDIEVVPRSPSTPEPLASSLFTRQKICPPEYPRKMQFHIVGLEGGSGRLNLHPSVSVSVMLLGSKSDTFTTERKKYTPNISWNSNTPAFFVDESSQVRFELNYHAVLKSKKKSLGSITLGIPELLRKAPKGTDMESFVEYRIPKTSAARRSSSESDRSTGSHRNYQPTDSDGDGLGPVLKFSIRDLVATGAASDDLLGIKPPGSPIDNTR